MKTLINITVMALVASLTFATVSSPTASASQPKALLVGPGHGPSPSFSLPKFGFNSFNIHGYGERVTFVQWGGLAAQMGLEPGDTVLSMNGFPMHYHGAWNDALYQAMLSGGWVQLTIRDVRTGQLAYRQLFVGSGGIGPITPKYHVAGYGPTTSHIVVGPGYGNPGYGNPGYNGGVYPVGPVTSKKMVGPQNPHMAKSIKQIVKMFED
jgi:hypothetical protein